MTDTTEASVSEKVLKGIVQGWNRTHPIGTPISYWRGLLEGPGTDSRVRESAWLPGGHTPVAMVEGYAGAIALTHIVNREV